MIRQGLWALAIPFASIAMAEGLTLQLPVDCTLGETCYIQQFMDRDPTEGVSDFQCRSLSYDGHKGTDFALPTRADMLAGVDVLAAADGRVRGARGNMPDTGYTQETADEIKGKECGNGIVIQHPNGWETQYCHLKQGSITVASGAIVKAGDVLGQIGQSGRAEFPHLHLSVRHNGKPVDPFDPDGTLSCASPGDSTLWADTPAYVPGGIIDVGITNAVPKYDDVKSGSAAADVLTAQAPALVAFAFTFGTLKDDIIRLTLTGPDGQIISQDQTLPRNHAQAFRAVGRKRPRRGDWPVGVYTANASLIRDGQVINSQMHNISITAE